MAKTKTAKITKTTATYDDLALLLAEGLDGAEVENIIAALKGLFPDIRIEETPKAYRYWFVEQE